MLDSKTFSSYATSKNILVKLVKYLTGLMNIFWEEIS